MKTITIKQPWASLIIEGYKDIENRTWSTKFRGRVLIHAGLDRKCKPDLSVPQLNKLYKYYTGIGTQPLKYGYIIGSVEIIDCVINHSSIWAEKTEMPAGCYMGEELVYNWVLANPIKFKHPIPAKGKLSFWDYPITDLENQ
jgi:hypothetical protein